MGRAAYPLLLAALCCTVLWSGEAIPLPKVPGGIARILGKKPEPPPPPPPPEIVSVTGEDIHQEVAPVLAEQIVDTLGAESEKPRQR